MAREIEGSVLFDELPPPAFTLPPSPFAQPLPSDAPACDGYDLVRILESDRVAIVYEATERATGERVALRALRTERIGEPTSLRVLEREARLLSRLRSPHVVGLKGVTMNRDGAPCLVLEAPKGKTLASILQTKPVFEQHEAVECILQVCAALETAMSAGVVHGDLSASNIIVNEEPGGSVVKVKGFGRMRPDIDAVVSPFAPPPELRYWAPEMLRHPDAVDPRSDLWSLGILLYRMLSGLYPYPERGQIALSSAISSYDPQHLVTIMLGVDRLLASVVMNLLRRDITLRYQSVEELMTALQPFAHEIVLTEDDLIPSVKIFPETG
ncbi:MAG: serine/threonine-protein kinase [Polyangiaceae bacterium]